jgi:hypothetical protein
MQSLAEPSRYLCDIDVLVAFKGFDCFYGRQSILGRISEIRWSLMPRKSDDEGSGRGFGMRDQFVVRLRPLTGQPCNILRQMHSTILTEYCTGTAR